MEYIDAKKVKITTTNQKICKIPDKLIYIILAGTGIFFEFMSDIYFVFAVIKGVFKNTKTKIYLKYLFSQSVIIIDQIYWIVQFFKFHKNLLFEEIFIILVCFSIKIYAILIRIRINLFKIYKRYSNSLVWEF